jgi:hypothetical protein
MIFENFFVYFMRFDGNKLSVKSPGVVVPMTGAISAVEIEVVKSEWDLGGRGWNAR